MLKKQMELLMNEQVNVALLDVEKAYVKKHATLSNENITETTTLPVDVIERCDKETEELLAEETASFLAMPVHYLKEHPNEFLYVASERLDVIRVESFALEFDEMFGVYSALFGLRLQKKQSEFLHTYLKAHLQHEKMTYSMIFAEKDGLWDVNIALDALGEFSEGASFDEVLVRLYRLIFALLEELEDTV